MPTVDRFALADGSYQHSLLRDPSRLGGFADAVRRAVRPGDVVADLGAGSGVLASVAVRAGAARVYAVEANRPALGHLRALLRANGLDGAVEAVEADVERWDPPAPVQVAVCELLETGLLHEPLAAAIRRVHAWPSRPRALVPRAVRLLVEGVALADAFEEYRAPLPGFRAEGSGQPMTDEACYLALDLERAAPPLGVDARVSLEAARSGTLHALRLRTLAEVSPGHWLGPSPAFCTPVVLPLGAPLPVREGQALEARLRYTFAFDEEPLAYDLS